MKPTSNSLFQLAVVVSALGFFVDVYDLLLFGIIRKPSLSDMGLSPAAILSDGKRHAAPDIIIIQVKKVAF